MRELLELTTIANDRFRHHLARLGGSCPPHRVEFSRRITQSWALIYYRRRLVRLSPYLFLLDADRLERGSHWRELDATLRHEAAHAATFARTGETSHSPTFHRMLARLGVAANGCSDLGPENAAFRYVYACPSCAAEWPRRARLAGNWSCGGCAPGAYSPEHRMVLARHLANPWTRLLERGPVVRRALEEAHAEVPVLRVR